ncbi:hypothetical protein ACHQM5_029157 [Ranunculus cassubicifolius]
MNGKIQDSFSSYESSWFDSSLRNKVLPSEDDAILGKSQKWDPRDLFYAIFMTLVHILCLFAPSTFSWSAFRVGLIGYILTGIFGVTISYHRNLSHRSFKLPKYLEYLFAYFALHAYQGDPIFWVSTHRYHHKVADTKRDPHSPIFEGMFHAHLAWIYDFNKIVRKGANYNNVRDLTKQPYYRFLQKTMVYHVYGLGIILYLLGGFPYIVWGLVRDSNLTLYSIYILHADIMKVWMSLFTFGDSWHNNHHAFAFSARHGLEWWQIDLTWYLIKSLAFLGLATDIKLPTEAHKKKKAFKTDPKDVKMRKDV